MSKASFMAWTEQNPGMTFSQCVKHLLQEKVMDQKDLAAKSCLSETTISRILRDRNDPSTLIPEISVQETAALFENGIIAGGMVPKVQCCVEAIKRGVKNVVIMDGRVPHAILMELLTDEGAGTMVTGNQTA